MRLALARASVQHYSLPNITYGQLENQHATGPLETYNEEGRGNFFETYATAVVVNGDWARISSILWNSLITDETTSNDIEDIYPTRHTWVGGGGKPARKNNKRGTPATDAKATSRKIVKSEKATIRHHPPQGWPHLLGPHAFRDARIATPAYQEIAVYSSEGRPVPQTAPTEPGASPPPPHQSNWKPSSPLRRAETCNNK